MRGYGQFSLSAIAAAAVGSGRSTGMGALAAACFVSATAGGAAGRGMAAGPAGGSAAGTPLAIAGVRADAVRDRNNAVACPWYTTAIPIPTANSDSTMSAGIR